MYKTLFFIPLLICASPALAQQGPPPQMQLPPELTDPATADRLAGAMQGVSDALLDMNVGKVRAAIKGRPPTAEERNLTVRELARRQDPDFDRKFQQRLATVGPAMQRSMSAINQALPEVTQALSQAQEAIERAVANMPDPNYPRR